MGEVNLSIHGKSYAVACDIGQESRVSDLGVYVDSRLREIAGAGAANNDSHLLVLTSLMLADEVYELREALRGMVPANSIPKAVVPMMTPEDEKQIVNAIEIQSGRIVNVAERLLKIA